MKHITKSYRQTQKLGEQLAKAILQLPAPSRAVVLCLYGDLGGGKTTFLQGFAKGLGIKQKVLSPTFVIMKRFENFYHIDAYRMKDYKDAKDLGLPEIMKKPENIIAIEWPERIKKILPKNAIKINFKFISNNKRAIIIK
jgi:tRNA threonylcarbamoyladenosine biosynthesis protein TsaE